MSNHNFNSIYNQHPNISTSNIVHDKSHAGIQPNIRMLEHIGDSSSVDKDVGYTELQRDIINDSESKLYKRQLHDVSSNDPVNPHGDKGFDYRDHVEEIQKDYEDFDPHTQYLHKNGLIGRNKTRYITSYVNIDSRDRAKYPSTTNDEPIMLEPNPLSFDANILRFDITDVDRSVRSALTPGTKIIVRGLEEYRYTLRSAVPDNFGSLVDSFVFEEDKQYMKVESNNNMDIQTGNIADVKEAYADIQVRFEGFVGDTKTQYFFDLTKFILSTAPDISDPTNTVFSIRENVYGDMLFKIADFTVDRYGIVIQDNTLRPYLDVITWTNVSTIPTSISLPPVYFTTATAALSGLPAPVLPTSFVEYMTYIQSVQNLIRSLVPAFVGSGVTAFTQNYADNNDTYSTSVQFVLSNMTSIMPTSRIGNLPTNFLNSTHRIFFTASDVEAHLANQPLTTDIPSGSNFFIELDRPYVQSPFTYTQPIGSSVLTVVIYTPGIYDVLLAFKHYGGVPNRLINAYYPLGPFTDAGFRIIEDVLEQNGRTYALVKLSRSGFLNRTFGGNCITISVVAVEASGFIQPNSYVVQFGRAYYKVVQIRMISSQFPITQKAFVDGVTGGTKNNMLYWQNLDDGSVVYSIEVEPGNYTSAELEAELESKAAQVMRFDEEVPRNIQNILKFDIDTDTDLVKVQSYNYFLSPVEPFVVSYSFVDINTIGDPANTVPNNAYYIYPTGQFYSNFPAFTMSDSSYRVQIYQPAHGLSVFDEIIIEGAINFGEIGPADLNGTHVVTQVIDANNYDIVLSNINLIVPIDPLAKGGYNVSILIPIKFRLLFDRPDTVGVQLGFRDVGLSTSITPYDFVITNDTLYADESLVNVLSLINPNATDITNTVTGTVSIRNSVVLVGPPYLLIVCPELSNVTGRGKVKDIFYKINLRDNSRNSGSDDRLEPMAYDTYADTPIFYNEPLRQLDRLTLSFVTPDGDAYDFNGIDHSFVLQIISFEEIPESTSLIKR